MVSWFLERGGIPVSVFVNTLALVQGGATGLHASHTPHLPGMATTPAVAANMGSKLDTEGSEGVIGMP